jgi:hypothetical protein
MCNTAEKRGWPTRQQCCGTENDLLQFRFRLWKSFESGSGSDFGKVLIPVPDPDNIYDSFPRIKNLYKILPFQCQKQHYFPKSWPLILDFFYFFIPFSVGP